MGAAFALLGTSMGVTTPNTPNVDDPEDVLTASSPAPADQPDYESADRLQGILERADGWPIWSANRVGGVDTGTYASLGMYGATERDLALWIAFRENDREALVRLTGWESDRALHIDPLPEQISGAFSDLLYGEEPEFFASDNADQENMEEMTEETALGIELKRWTDMFVSEGETWWRAWTDRNVSEWPLVDASSRINVIPLFVGRKIVAAAFTDTVYTQEIKVENQLVMHYWRHIEIQARGYVRNLLYLGTIGQLGRQMQLSSLPETRDLEEDWEHGLPVMLAGRIPNKIGRDFRLGISQYHGVRDLLMDLNEARTIAAENARLVLKARMVVPANAVDGEGNFDAGKDVLVHEAIDEELGGKNNGPYAVLEYSFKAEEIIKHKTELTLDILARTGLAEQFVQESRGGSGQAFTGTALRTRLIPTTLAANGKAKNVDREVPRILRALALLSALEIEKGGCGKKWADAGGKHRQKRANILPEDENEATQRHVMGVQGEVESIQHAVENLHPDWDEDSVALEVMRIRADRTLGPTYTDPDEDADDLEEEIDSQQPNVVPNATGTGTIPNVPPGGPGSAVPTPSSVLGSQQPGSRRPVDGQSPGKRPPIVPGGGPK